MMHKLSKKKIPNSNRSTNEDQYLQNKRLKSLYDAIDDGRNKDSIDIAEKVVRKFSAKDRNTLNDRITVNTAQALKALALIRLESTAEAAVLVENCENALAGGEFHEGTLQVLFHCFKESYIPNRIPQLVEKILKIQPPSEWLLLDLYFGYARIMDFKNQQRVANLLYRDYENVKYFFWSINSLIMQAIASPALSEKMYLPLAQRMLEKIASTKHKIDRTEIVLNHHVLAHRELYDKAFEYLEKASIDGHLNKQDSNLMKFELLKKSRRFDQLIEFIAEEIKEDKLNFAAWETLFWIYEQASEKNDQALQQKAIETFDNLSKQYLSEPNDYSQQSLIFLKLLFVKKLSKLNHTEQINKLTPKFGTILNNLKQFIVLVYTRPNGFADIFKFLHLLNEEEKVDLLKFVDEKITDQSETINYAFLLRELIRVGFGHHRKLDINQRSEFVLKLISDLRKNAKSNPNLDSHTKVVTLLVSNILWDTYLETGSQLYLYQLAAILEFIFDRCSNVFISAILLVRIYTLLGNMNRIVALFNQLDVKYFQRDSLGYLTFASAMQFGRFREAIYYYTSVTAQFDHNERETCESIVTANKVLSLDQIPRLVEFSEHCRSSIYAFGADILNQLLSTCFAVDNLHFALITLRGDDERIDWNKVTDSRDFGILQTIALADENLTDKVKKLTFAETFDHIKLMHGLGRVISDVGVANLPIETFEADFATVRNHLTYCKELYSSSETVKYLQGFGAPQLASFINYPFLDSIIALLNLASRIFAIEGNNEASAFDELVKISDELAKKINFDVVVFACDINSQSFSAFLENGTHSILTMTLCELLIKFMEARVAAILPKFKENLTLEKIEKASVQQQEFIEHLSNLKISTAENDDQQGEEAQSGRKSKKLKQKPYDELTNEQKIAVSFKIAQKTLLTSCYEFEQKVVKATEKLNSTKTFFDDENKIDFKAAELDKYVDFVDRSLIDSHLRSLEDLKNYTGRILHFASLPQRFNLLNVHNFTGSSGK